MIETTLTFDSSHWHHKLSTATDAQDKTGYSSWQQMREQEHKHRSAENPELRISQLQHVQTFSLSTGCMSWPTFI